MCPQPPAWYRMAEAMRIVHKIVFLRNNQVPVRIVKTLLRVGSTRETNVYKLYKASGQIIDVKKVGRKSKLLPRTISLIKEYSYAHTFFKVKDIVDWLSYNFDV